MGDRPVPAGAERPALVLASASPRRAELLAGLGLAVRVEPADVDERWHPGESPEAYVARVAVDKARARVGPGRVVLAADTAVVVDGAPWGKPADADDARRMLRALAGRTHEVHTTVVAATPAAKAVRPDVALVTMAPLTGAEIEWYVATGEPLDKAGGYAIQGAGGYLVARVEGNVQTVIGLSLRAVAEALAEIGFDLLDWARP